jgi:hypothetical protein
LEDRQQDLNEQERNFHERNSIYQNASPEFESLLNSLHSLPEPEMAKNFIMSTLSNITGILKGVYPKNEDFISSEERSFIFSMVKNSTKNLAAILNDLSKDPSAAKDINITQFQRAYIDSIENVLKPYSAAFNAPQQGTGNVQGLYKELESLKKKVLIWLKVASKFKRYHKITSKRNRVS